MRITNKIMQNNAISNLNKLKVLQDNLNTQMTTNSKITRPSDDPVVAIRALRLRTDLTEITQYYEKNIPDAKSWLSVTENALSNTTDILTEMYLNCESSANGYLEAEDRMKILENLIALRDEVYASGDADYAGRNIFTGYRTDVRLTFQSDTEIPYTITEQLTKSVVDSINYIEVGDLIDGSYATGSTSELDVASYEVARIRLSYTDLEDVTPKIQVASGAQDEDGNNIMEPLQVNDDDVVIETMSETDDPSPYTLIGTDAYSDKVIFVPETGELLLGSEVEEAIASLSKTEEIQITYDKTNWDEGDLRPEHYFACEATVNGATVKYNEDKLKSTLADLSVTNQYITYDVGFNQDITVNTLASDCFTHDIGLDVDELIEVTQQAIDLAAQMSDLESMLSSDKYTDAEKEEIQARLDATTKASTLINDKCQKLFESAMTKMQDYLDQANLALTNVGSTSARLDLIESRLESQQTSLQELKDDNESADITALAVQISSAEVSYNAALAATGKIIQNSLMNFI